ncbi:molybdenum cofactor biosynthesis protein MoaE [Candidatus Venteria ishoeyi]|uniref:Molybdopterin synthase catalytic subunit n=1 Tax=Candidatus Venteria ishoeyi TaxID=1899563 RepID=A0A1H6FHC5_9GAMM|nr:molybdenum cofactor biosynthesis protein MoaE [Candidatus Venteria ishoeyi]SEH09053.1 Molybdopterin synthase catalytic subunit [Candidatus Venteria ishoeyi]
MSVQLTEQAFNPWQILQTHESQLEARYGKGHWGAASHFIGTMRDLNEGDSVQAMFLEHYPGMTESYLKKISDEALQRWDILDTLILHRVGTILPGENIVLVAAWASHRGPAFDACRYLIEELKHRAPFWKRETLPDQARWVSENTPA